MVSTCPYSMVQLDGSPSRWASRCTASHSSPESFLSAMVARAAGLNTSAPPPGRLVTPACCMATSTPRTLIPSMRARLATPTAQHAHVGRIDVLIGRERRAVAVLATVRLVRQAADGEEVVRGEQRQRVVAGQALGALDLLGDRIECWIPGRHGRGRLRIADFGLRIGGAACRFRNSQSAIRNVMRRDEWPV